MSQSFTVGKSDFKHWSFSIVQRIKSTYTFSIALGLGIQSIFFRSLSKSQKRTIYILLKCVRIYSDSRLYKNHCSKTTFLRSMGNALVRPPTGLFYIERDLHSRTGIGERDIVLSAQEWGHADVARGDCVSQATQAEWRYQGISPPNSTFTQAKISDFEEKRLKSMTASF